MSVIQKLLLTFLFIFLFVLSLQQLLGVYAILVPAFFMFFDISYFLRIFWRLGKKIISRSRNQRFLDVSEFSFYVLPSDLDMMLHMNNAR